VAQLDSVKSTADTLRLQYEKSTLRKEEVSEEKKELGEQLKRL